MKKVIDGKVFDTETAEEIASYENSYAVNDFHYLEETLYKTKSGRFFLAGSGGAMTKYQRPAGSNSWSGGDGLEVLTEAEALFWCEEHDVDADLIAEHFTVEEG